MASKLREHLQCRYWFERSLAMDKLCDAPYGLVRQEALRDEFKAGYLAEQYGLLTARSESVSGRFSLRIQNEMSGGYQRTRSSEKFADLCYSNYLRVIDAGKSTARAYVLFANSMQSARRMEARFELEAKKNRVDPRPMNFRFVHDGLVAIELDATLCESDVRFSQRILSGQGATPSLYNVQKHAIQAAEEPASSAFPDNWDFPGNMPPLRLEDALATLSALPAQHPLQALSRTAFLLVRGLHAVALSTTMNNTAVQRSQLAANALSNVEVAARVLPVVLSDTSRFASVFAVLVEEINLLLAQTRPYTSAHYKAAASTQFNRRAQIAGADRSGGISESFLVASGMQAVAVAIELAKKAIGIGEGERQVDLVAFDDVAKGPAYYELPRLAGQDIASPGTGRIVLATLNGSLPARRHETDAPLTWDVDRLIAEVKERIKAAAPSQASPLVLILDRTLEKKISGEISELSNVLAAIKEEIDAGRLIIFLCRSYQKYQSLGSAKIMAGEIMMIARPGRLAEHCQAMLREAEDELNWFANDECQLLTHFLVHAPSQELDLLEAASANAAFVHEHCFQPEQGRLRGFDAFEPGLPFGVLSPSRRPDEEKAIVHVRLASVTERYFVQNLLEKRLPTRESFAFTTSNVGRLPLGATRISFGQESRDELVEALYAIGWVKKQGSFELKVSSILAHVREIARCGSEIVLADADVLKWAQAAIDVLEKRGSRVDTQVATCKALLNQLYSAERNARTLALGLRTLLREALAAGRQSESLQEDVIILAAAFAPVVESEATEHVQRMQASLNRDPAGLGPDHPEYFKARYALSMIASMLRLDKELFSGLTEEDAEALRKSYKSLLRAGLPGFSVSARDMLVFNYLRHLNSNVDLEDPAEIEHYASEILGTAHLLSGALQKGRLALDIKDKLISRLAPETRRKLVDRLLLPLGATIICNCLEDLIHNQRLVLASALKEAILFRISECLEGRQVMDLPVELRHVALHRDGTGAPLGAVGLAVLRAEVEKITANIA